MSSMARSLPRAASGANAADKRKKQILLVGGVLLVVLVVFQVMRLGGGSAPTASPSSAVAPSDGTATVPTTSGAVTGGAGTTFATSPKASRQVLDRLPAKDPFVPLVPGGTGFAGIPSAESPTPPTSDVETPTPKAPSPDAKADSPPPVVSAPEATAPKPANLPPPTAAIISVNGSSQTVGRSKLFPAKAPAFRLVTVGRTFVRIGVAGGTFTRGRPTITIRRGQKITLVNTATGVRYVLRFAAPSTASAEPAAVPAGERDK